MGVSGAGKSTIATLVAHRLGWEVAEGDDLHPAANIRKLAEGHPLTDADRAPWLAAVAAWIDDHIATGRSGVITCSALRRSYRDTLRRPQVVFVYLAGTREQLAARLAARSGHFMPAALLDSQLAALEPPSVDEHAITVDVGDAPDRTASEIIDWLRTHR
jgi:gluconokinase